MDGDGALERPLRLGLDHLPLDLCQYAEEKKSYVSENRVWDAVYAHRVFPIAHSTQPRSGPKVRTGVRISSGMRPSRRCDSLSAEKRNSRSGIEGDGGRIVCVV